MKEIYVVVVRDADKGIEFCETHEDEASAEESATIINAEANPEDFDVFATYHKTILNKFEVS